MESLVQALPADICSLFQAAAADSRSGGSAAASCQQLPAQGDQLCRRLLQSREDQLRGQGRMTASGLRFGGLHPQRGIGEEGHRLSLLLAGARPQADLGEVASGSSTGSQAQ